MYILKILPGTPTHPAVLDPPLLEQLSAVSPWKGRQVKVTPGREGKPLFLDGAAALGSTGAAQLGQVRALRVHIIPFL